MNIPTLGYENQQNKLITPPFNHPIKDFLKMFKQFCFEIKANKLLFL